METQRVQEIHQASGDKHLSAMAFDYLAGVSGNLASAAQFLGRAGADPRVIQRIYDLSVETGSLAQAVRSGIGTVAGDLQ